METLGSKQVYANAWMTVREDEIRRADGSTGIYGVVDSQDIALIIAAEHDRLHLIQQYRYPVVGRRWEFPSGSAPRFDLEPSVLAARELREETGLRAGAMAHLGTLDVAPGMSSQHGWVFLATGWTAGERSRSQRTHCCSSTSAASTIEWPAAVIPGQFHDGADGRPGRDRQLPLLARR
jgi:hypothetical protein